MADRIGSGKPGRKSADVVPLKAKGHKLEPGPGHNGPTDEDIRHHIAEQAKYNAKRDALRGEINTFRKLARAKGIVLAKADHILKMAAWTPQEIQADFATERRYAEVMGMPVGTQLELFPPEDAAPDVREKGFWRGKGRMDGLVGTGDASQPPDGCPEECRKPYGDGWLTGEEERKTAYRMAAKT